MNKSFVLSLVAILGFFLAIGGTAIFVHSKRIQRTGMILTTYQVSTHYFPIILISIGLMVFALSIIMLILK